MFFSVDVHGAESVWRKWLRVPELYEADALLLCGDLTGKSLVPLINRGSGKWNAYYFGRNWTLQEGSELDAMEKRIMDSGSYTLRCGPDEVKELQNDPTAVERLMMAMIKDRMARWMEMLIEKVDLSAVDAIVMPGNDDDWEIDDVISSFQDRGVRWCLDEPVDVLGAP